MREMKDSGIEWIGEIPIDWQLPKVKKLFSVGRGRVISQLELEESGYPVYSSQTKNNGCLGYISTYDFDRSQLTWTTDGANAGTVFLREGKHNCTNVCGTLMPKNDENSLEYLKYALEFIAIYHKRADINGYKIMNNEMAEIVVTLPTRTEQEKIARFLNVKCTELDNILTKTRTSIEEYRKLKQAIITQAVTKGIDENREMKDISLEWLGRIPADWNLIRITKLLDYDHLYPIGDGDHGLIKTDDYSDSGIPYIRVQNLGWGTALNCENIVYISEERNQMIASSILKPNDILFAKTGATIGKTAIVPDSMPVSNTTSHIGKITVSSNYNPKFVFYVMSSYVVYRQFWEIAGLKSTRPELSIDEIKKIRLTIPSSQSEQDRIVKYLDRTCKDLDELIYKKESYLVEIEKYKKSLIYEYVTGKKEVPETWA